MFCANFDWNMNISSPVEWLCGVAEECWRASVFITCHLGEGCVCGLRRRHTAGIYTSRSKGKNYGLNKDAGIILHMCPANEKRRYNATSSPIGWAHTQIDPWGVWVFGLMWRDLWSIVCNISGLVQDCSISSVLVIEMMKVCSKLLITIGLTLL